MKTGTGTWTVYRYPGGGFGFVGFEFGKRPFSEMGFSKPLFFVHP